MAVAHTNQIDSCPGILILHCTSTTTISMGKSLLIAFRGPQPPPHSAPARTVLKIGSYIFLTGVDLESYILLLRPGANTDLRPESMN